MEIRKDFEPVAVFMHRLLKFAEAFSENNNQHWSHLRNKEDFQKVYLLPNDIRNPIEQIYCDGRDCAVSMAGKLRAFNYADEYPSLSSYIDSFKGGWVYQEVELNQVYEKAKKASETLENCPWAVGQMLDLFKEQLKLLDATKNTLNFIKQSHLYKLEKGDAPVEKETGINIGSINGKVNINSTDNSVNISTQTNNVFSQLQEAILNSNIDKSEKERLALSAREMQETYGKEGFLQKYKDFMQDAANHMTVFVPLLPALAGLLS